MRHIKFTSILIAILLLSCSSQKESANSKEVRSYQVGEGGGFSGIYITFNIYSDGKVEKQEGNTFQKIGDLDKELTASLFEELDELNLQEMEMDQPGNMSRYIIISTGENEYHQLTWPMQEQAVSKKILAFWERSYNAGLQFIER